MTFERVLTVLTELVQTDDNVKDWFEDILYRSDEPSSIHFIDILHNLLQQILDPCSIFDETQMKQLKVSAASVITSTPRLYYSYAINL